MASVYELAQQIKRQEQRGGGNQFFDNSMRVMQYLDERSKESTARKVQGMEVALGDFNKVYDNTILKDRMDVFEKRFGGKNLNRMGADERAAYDNAKIMMSRQMEKNTDFDMYENKLKDASKAMTDWMSSADGDTQPDPDAMNRILLDYMDTRANFATRHQDRLGSQAFSYLNKEMDSIHEMGSFGVASMADDGVLSQGEAKAMAQSLTTLDPKYISEYKIERKRTESEGHQANVKVMETTMKTHAFYKDLVGRISTKNPEALGEEGYVNDKGTFVPMSKAQASKLMRSAEFKLSNLDDKYKNNINNVEGKSYLEMTGFGHIADTGGNKIIDPNIDPKTGKPYTGGEHEDIQESVEGEIVEGDDTTDDPKIDLSILNPDEESANIQNWAVNAVKGTTNKVNKAKKTLEILQSGKVAPSYYKTSFGASKPTEIGKHLDLKEGEFASLAQLKGIKDEYEKEKADSDNIKEEIKALRSVMRGMPKSEKIASMKGYQEKIKTLKSKQESFKSNWLTKHGQRGSLLKEVYKWISKYEQAEKFYDSELERLRKLQERTKKD